MNDSLPLSEQPRRGTDPGDLRFVVTTSPIELGREVLYSQFVGAFARTYFISATLKVDGSFEFMRERLALPDVVTNRSVRFALWNNEETGLNGARAYVEQRAPLQGKENPPGSGRYPEPKWLAMIQHDMMMWDHGMPRADGTWNPEQRPEADVNIEFQSTAKRADEAMKLAFFFRDANEKYATDYPAAVGNHMTNTDSTPFMDIVPAISLRENERGMHTGAGWNPTWHQPIDVFTTFSDKDFRLGLNAAQTTLAAIAQLTNARTK